MLLAPQGRFRLGTERGEGGRIEYHQPGALVNQLPAFVVHKQRLVIVFREGFEDLQQTGGAEVSVVTQGCDNQRGAGYQPEVELSIRHAFIICRAWEGHHI